MPSVFVIAKTEKPPNFRPPARPPRLGRKQLRFDRGLSLPADFVEREAHADLAGRHQRLAAGFARRPEGAVAPVTGWVKWFWIERVFEATWQQCRVHWMRKALARFSRGQHTVVAAAIRQAFDQPDRRQAAETWRRAADQLRSRWPRLAELMDEREHDVLA